MEDQHALDVTTARLHEQGLLLYPHFYKSYKSKLGSMVEQHALVLAILSSLVRAANISVPAFTCSKLTIETLEQGVKYVQG